MSLRWIRTAALVFGAVGVLAAPAAAQPGKERREERREKRKERRKERREKLKERWGDLLEKGPVKAELARHGRRVARLNRMLSLAEEAKKDDAVKRIKELMEKENARHDARMAKLKEKGGAE
jgi:predicted nuclease with TOPRIM domain